MCNSFVFLGFFFLTWSFTSIKSREENPVLFIIQRGCRAHLRLHNTCFTISTECKENMSVRKRTSCSAFTVSKGVRWEYILCSSLSAVCFYNLTLRFDWPIFWFITDSHAVYTWARIKQTVHNLPLGLDLIPWLEYEHRSRSMCV